MCPGTAVHKYIKSTRLSCYHHLKRSDGESVICGRKQLSCPHSLPPTVPITRINTMQSTLGDVPLHMAIPGQPLTTLSPGLNRSLTLLIQDDARSTCPNHRKRFASKTYERTAISSLAHSCSSVSYLVDKLYTSRSS